MLTVNEGLEDQDKYFVVVVEMMPLQCPLQVLSSIHVPTALIAVFRIPTSGLQHSNPCFRSVCTVHVLCFCLRFPYLVPPTIFDEFHRHCGLLGQKNYHSILIFEKTVILYELIILEFSFTISRRIYFLLVIENLIG